MSCLRTPTSPFYIPRQINSLLPGLGPDQRVLGLQLPGLCRSLDEPAISAICSYILSYCFPAMQIQEPELMATGDADHRLCDVRRGVSRKDPRIQAKSGKRCS